MSRRRNIYGIFKRETKEKVFEGDSTECAKFLGYANAHSFMNAKIRGATDYYFDICGQKPAGEYLKVKCVCVVCGEEFLARPHKGDRYCSDECRKIAKRKRDAINNNRKRKTEITKDNDGLVEKAKIAKELNITYGQLIAKDTIEKFARVDVNELLGKLKK